MNKILLLTICIINIFSIVAINHWALKNGKISQKIDSPFYLREPNNLIVFLEQIKHNDIVESTYMNLLRQREKTIDQIDHSIKFGMEVIEQAKCALDFYKIESAMTYTKITKDYLKRISIKNKNNNIIIDNSVPHCWKYIPLKSGICCYDHLESLTNTINLHIEPEEELNIDELEINSKYFLSNLLSGLEDNPNSWKYHTLGSYYWRMKGDAHQAIECARRGVMLAPRKFRDIPLLSLGLIMWRAEKLRDAEVIFSAAVDHAPEIPENHFALGTTLVMLYEFNRSTTHFETAEKLNDNQAGLSYIEKEKLKNRTQHLKNFVSCIKNLNTKTAKMYKNVEFIKEEVNGLKDLKNIITASHEKLIQQQVPLGARYVDVGNSNKELLHRGQYCSTRTSSGNDEPVLFCDFYSELQMRLESAEVDIDELEREITVNTEAILKKLSVDINSQFVFDKKMDK